ncbi:hypothetical protein KY335_04335 [Candidatus Woesearchaeota archaeon]|nr:hypothetical protein [Candidatus Woesearchaeota archaeon]MBW3014436.1 hypothetical protein [Candidatus Woesearchaeota archaeon]
MKSVKFEALEKEYPREAEEFVTDQKVAVTFLNSPVRGNWMSILELDKKDVEKIKAVVDSYAKQKIIEVNKKSPQSRKEVIQIENEIFEKMFEGRVFRIKHIKERVPDKVEAIEIVEKMLKNEYPEAAILDMHKLERLATLCALENETPSEFMVFDPKSMKIISAEVVVED